MKHNFYLRAIVQWLVILGVLGALIWIYLPGYSRYHKLREREVTLDQKLEDLTRQIEILQEEKYLLENDITHLEKVVRERLGRVEPGETVYKIVNEPVVKGPGYQIQESTNDAPDEEANVPLTPGAVVSASAIAREANKV